MKIRTLLILLLAFTFASLSWASEADDILKKSGDRFQKFPHWSLKFSVELRMSGSNEVAGGYQGELLLGRGDHFRLSLPGQVYSSDGITLWQYSQAQKQVMIKNLADLQGGMHPSEALFRYLKCKPISMTRITADGIPVYALKLDPAGQVKSFVSMEVWLRQSDETPVKIVTVDRTGTSTTYHISNLQKNSVTTDADFRFETPKGVEEVDMR